MTSFNYDENDARTVGLTNRCHLSRMMPDGIFYESMGGGVAQLFFRKSDKHRFPQHKRDVPVSFVVFYHGYCKYCQKNLPDRMFRHDTNTTLSESCVIFITLVNMAYDESGCSLYLIYSFLAQQFMKDLLYVT